MELTKVTYYTLFTLFTLCLNSTSYKNISERNTLVKKTIQRPNIILIMADDLGFETIGSYGNTVYKTPHLDKLSAEGMQFENCHSMPLCTPSRVQIMTGKYNFRNYVGFGILDAKEKTFGHYLKEIGYKTCIVGKWQLYGNKLQHKLAGGIKGTMPHDAGFDEYCLWQTTKLGSRYRSPTIDINGTTKTYKGEYGPDIFVNYIENFMDKNRETPFFIYYPMVIPHNPFVPSPNHSDFKNFNATNKTNDAKKYFGDMISYMDKLVGKIVAKTEDLGIKRNTLILFVGDNGTDRRVTTPFKNKQFKGAKGSTTYAGTHVPFIAHWEGKIQPNQHNTNLIDFTDFLPSLLEISQHPKQKEIFSDGISFYPQMIDKKSKNRDWIFCHYNPKWGKFKTKIFVHNKEWKLYSNGKIFNLKNDPFEKKPLKKSNLSKKENTIINMFKKVLDTMK